MKRNNFLVLLSVNAANPRPAQSVLILQLGADHWGGPESKALAWLNSHRPN